jgi:tetratricopeptide (TPR) repeat protein
LIFTCAAPNFAKTRKGEKLLKEGIVAEGKGDWDRALELYQQAVDESPFDSGYQIPMRRARFQAGQMHVDRGEKLRSQGKLEEAMEEFQRAIMADPGSAIGIQNLRVTKQMVDREKQQPSSSVEERGLTPIERSRKDTEARIATILSLPELKPTQPVPPLKMNNQSPRVLYETVGKVAGINVPVRFAVQRKKHSRVQRGHEYVLDRAGVRLPGDADAHLLEADYQQYDFRHRRQSYQASRLRRQRDEGFLRDQHHNGAGIPGNRTGGSHRS